MNLNLLTTQDDLYLNIIDWPSILSLVQNRLSLNSSKFEVKKPLGIKSKKQIEKNFDDLEFFVKSNIEERLKTLPSTIELLNSSTISTENLLKSLKIEKLLNLKELNYLAQIFEIYFYLGSLLKDWNNLFYSEKSQEYFVIKKLFYDEIRKIISKDNISNFLFHPKLGPIQKDINNIEKKIDEQIEEIFLDPLFHNSLQFKGYNNVNDHFVIAIKTERYQQKMGQIIYHSDSGQTLYVEPFSISNLRQNRLESLALLEREITILCLEMCNALRPYINFFHEIFYQIVKIDILNAKAILSIDLELVRPEIANDFTFIIDNFFHPLIENPVKNSIELKLEELGVIISGPNTGGKTVALKSLCICQMFLQFGLFIPASSAKIYPVQGIYFLGHDMQNIHSGLSSFSAEVTQYLTLLNELKESNLIFIDEIFNSTSSEEASALAFSFIKYLNQSSHSKIFLSTHHHMLKKMTHEINSYLSAHVGFNPKTNTPTYKLIWGNPGSSLALKIFRQLCKKLNFSNTIIAEMAESYLAEETLNYEKLLEDLSEQKTIYTNLIEENKKINLELINKKRSLEGLFELEKNKIINNFEKQLSIYLKKAIDYFEQEKKERRSAKNLINEMYHIKAEAKEFIESNRCINNSSVQQKSKTSQQQLTPQIGSLYYHSKLKKNAQLLEFDSTKNTCLIKINRTKIQCKLSDLCNISHENQSIKKENSDRSVIVNIFDSSDETSFKFDGRGLRAEEFERLVFKGINQLYRNQVPYIEIIHGLGTGILKNWLKKFLIEHVELEEVAKEDGNDGSTIIRLKD